MQHAHRTAAILAIGDELTLGQKVDTNSAWISDRLMAIGILPVEHVTVPDDLAAHVDALRRLASRVDLIVSSGGLGPTHDDLSREALATAMDDRLVEDAESLAQIRAWYEQRGREMPPLNAVQALRPSRARSLRNHHGTAPGIAGSIARENGWCDVLCVPGPPGEMKPMFDRSVAPSLRPVPDRSIRARVIHTFGLGESEVATRLGALMSRDRMPLVGTNASSGVVSCRVRYDGPGDALTADAAIDATASEIHRVLGDHIFGSGDESQASALVALLRAQSRTLAVAESCTGGLLGSMIADVAGCSDVFLGGWITYANEMKSSALGIDRAWLMPDGPGAVSAEVAGAMARGACRVANASVAIAITGVAGPSGGTDAKPVGTVWIATALRAGNVVRTDARRFLMTGDRRSVREWSARSALGAAWLMLQGRVSTPLLRQQQQIVTEATV